MVKKSFSSLPFVDRHGPTAVINTGSFNSEYNLHKPDQSLARIILIASVDFHAEDFEFARRLR
jgi:hypothetical protein